MARDTANKLYPLFSTGRGESPADRTLLASELQIHRKTVDYHLMMWEKAGRPVAPGAEPSTVQAEASTVTEPAADNHEGQTPPAEHDQPAAASETPAVEPVERLPEVGQVYEGRVERSTEGFALVNLLEFYDETAGKWMRGIIRGNHVLRRGYCTDVSRWLQPGDPVMVKVLTLEEGPGQGVIRWRLNLSTKLAPAHPDERITFEQQGESSVSHTSEQPITARGSEVAAGIQTESTAVDPARVEARIQARELLRRNHVDLSHLEEYTERILTSGLTTTTFELQRDLDVMRDLQSAAAVDEHMEVTLEEALKAKAAELGARSEEVWRKLVDQLQEQLTKDTANRGLCAICVKANVCPVALDPYFAESLELADDDKPDKLKHMQLVYGPRPLLKCKNYLAKPYEGAAS